jgi:environmental stress-induced protein Ves
MASDARHQALGVPGHAVEERGGVTTEIYVSSPFGAFDWRVSIATVNAEGPFSAFTGYERHIMTLSGGGMVLDIEGRGKFTLEPLRPFSFSGDAKVHGSLLQGAVMDFNLMVRRDFGSGTLRVRECKAGDRLGSEKNLYLAHVLQGECEAEGHQFEPNSSFCLGSGEFFTLPAPLKLAICEITPRLLPSPNA